jgi:hypothetical protein
MDQKTKHTPGPWVVLAGRVISTRSGQFYLTYGKDKYGNPLFKDFVELDHNASLIAAAPAMYEALLQTRKVIEAIDDYQVFEDLQNVLIAINKTLAQAEGIVK